MRQLSGIDVSFLNMEVGGTYGHVSSLNLYDPSGAPGGAGLAATKDTILQRIDQLAPFRRRLVEVPFGLGRPYWIEDPDFDIDYHVRHHAVPPPGDPHQLAEVVSRIHARPLDRRSPLWELYVIEGVDDGRLVAQVTKVHHAAVDGAAGALMLAALLDVDPEARPTNAPIEWVPDEVPEPTELLKRTLVGYVRTPDRFARHTYHTVRAFADRSSSGSMQVLGELIVASPSRPDRTADQEPSERQRAGSRPPAAAAPCRGTAHPVQRLDHGASAVFLLHLATRGRQDHPPQPRLHLQRCRHGALQQHAARVPHRARRPSRRAAGGDGAGEHPYR